MSGDVFHDLRRNPKIYAPDSIFGFSFFKPILHLQKQVEKFDYEKKSVGKTTPTISRCILHFLKYYMHMFQAL